MLIVFDTAVIISAFLKKRGTADKILEKGAQGAFLICTSEVILQELTKKLESKFKVPPQKAKEIAVLFRGLGEPVKTRSYSPEEIALDEHIFDCFKMAKADLIVTLDKGLIKEAKIRGIPAVHLSDFKYYFPEF